MTTFLHLLSREFRRVFARKSALVIMLVIPLVVFFYLGSIYIRGSIEKVPIMVVNLDRGELSNQILNALGSSPRIEIEEYVKSAVEPEKVFLDYPGIKGILILPQGLSSSVFKGNQTKIKVFTNSSNIIYGNLIYKDIATFINTVSAGISLNYLMLEGLPQKAAENLVMPIRVQPKPLFNPYYNYLYYLLPGLTSVLLQMIVFFLAARSMNSEFSDKTFSNLLALSRNRIHLILGSKLCAYTLIGMCIALFIYAVVHPVMGIPTSSSILSFVPFLLLFVMTNAMLGLMISMLFINEAIAMDTAFVYNSPAFVFSGFTFPILAMPGFDSWYAQLIPYTHFLKAFTKTVEMEGTLQASAPEAGVLLIFFLVGYLVFTIGLGRKSEIIA
jgi:ABC-2 type transport system permease protein